VIEIQHQVKKIRDGLAKLEALIYAHRERHQLNGGDPLELDATQIVSGVFDEARIPHVFTQDITIQKSDPTLFLKGSRDWFIGERVWGGASWVWIEGPNGRGFYVREDGRAEVGFNFFIVRRSGDLPAELTFEDVPNSKFGYLTYDGSTLEFKISGDIEKIIFSGNLIPDVDNAYNIGSSTERFKSLYLSDTIRAIGSTALVTNLNADLWDGHHWGALYPNADKLDGYHESAFGRLSAARTWTATQIFAGSPPIRLDSIAEYTTDHGVEVDGVLCKDGVIPTSAYPQALLRDGSRTVTGDLLPDSDNAYNLGSSSKRWALVNCRQVQNPTASLGLMADGDCYLGAGAAWRWLIDSLEGDLLPYTDNAFDIGRSAARVAKIYAVNTNFGEVGFSDTVCRKCGEPFKVGDEIVFKVIETRAGYVETVPVHKDCKEKEWALLDEGEYEVIDEAVLDERHIQLNVRYWDGIFAAIPVRIDASETEVEGLIRKYHDDVKLKLEKQRESISKGKAKKKVSWKGCRGKLKLQ